MAGGSGRSGAAAPKISSGEKEMAEVAEKAATLPRFDGAAAWAVLTPEQQTEIGAIALEFVVNMNGEDAYFSDYAAEMPAARPFIAAQPVLTGLLLEAVQGALCYHHLVPALDDDALPVPIPSLLGQVCRVCLCSEYDPCDEGCGWAQPDLCTACVTEPA
jgi:hypothetical protein